MKNNSDGINTLAAVFLGVCFILCIVGILSFSKREYCSMSGCDNEAKEGSSYCYMHDRTETGVTSQRCLNSGCDNFRATESSYCYLHKSYSNAASSTSKSTSTSMSEEDDCFIAMCTKKQSPKTYYCYEHACEIYGKEIVDGLKAGTMTINEATALDNKNKGSSKKKSSHDSYDEGYEAVSEDDDYDWDRYWSDSDYADGVDDAMEDYDW